MKIQLPSLYLTLLPNQPLTMAGGVGTEIRVLEGRVWITEESLSDDIFVDPGSGYRLRSQGRAVIDSDEFARIVVQTPVLVRRSAVRGERLQNIAAWVKNRARLRPKLARLPFVSS